jgi:hypothetical protein
VHTRAQKDLAEAKSQDFDLTTPEGGSLAVRPRQDWYQTRAVDLTPLSAKELELLRVVDNFGIAGVTAPDAAKALGQDIETIEVRQVLAAMHRRGVVRLKGEKWFVDKVGRVHLSGTLDSVRQD